MWIGIVVWISLLFSKLEFLNYYPFKNYLVPTTGKNTYWNLFWRSWPCEERVHNSVPSLDAIFPASCLPFVLHWPGFPGSLQRSSGIRHIKKARMDLLRSCPSHFQEECLFFSFPLLVVKLGYIKCKLKRFHSSYSMWNMTNSPQMSTLHPSIS